MALIPFNHDEHLTKVFDKYSDGKISGDKFDKYASTLIRWKQLGDGYVVVNGVWYSPDKAKRLFAN